MKTITKETLNQLAKKEIDYIDYILEEYEANDLSCVKREFLKLFGWEFETNISKDQLRSDVNQKAYANGNCQNIGIMRKIKITKFDDVKRRGDFIKNNKQVSEK